MPGGSKTESKKLQRNGADSKERLYLFFVDPEVYLLATIGYIDLEIKNGGAALHGEEENKACAFNLLERRRGRRRYQGRQPGIGSSHLKKCPHTFL
ncbi:hypothetical protein DAMNIGENAA_31800 [Desulforhabdus amnigena]|jgi:hypothetical protein|uniref:Uncharacterized protein n=1 Tax=Desulforhabdus amnigena TaxID=40218 RepID=A0A9W6FVT7_9BACT|nr:hypothetical protein DAMNIGENAA_31800 [Desulforhabdus amnigena]